MGKYADLLKDLTENEEVDTVSTLADESAGVAAGNEAGMKLLDNVMQMAEWGIGSPIDYLRSVGRVPPRLGGEPLPTTEFPGGNEVLATLSPGDTQTNLAEIAGRREANREQYPYATLGGSIFGDYATLQGVRSTAVVEPARKWRVARQNMEAFKEFEKAESLRRFRPVDPKLKEMIVTRFNELAPKVGLTTRRIAETGAEGAFIAALNDSDVPGTAAWAAGTRAAAAPFMWAANGWLGLPAYQKGLSMLGAGVLIAFGQNIAPFVEGDFLKGEDIALDKLALVGGLGMMAGGFYGRIRHPLADTRFGAQIFDAVTTANRTLLLEAISAWNKDPEGMTEAQDLVNAVAADPLSFPDEFHRRLDRGLKGARELPEVVQELKADGKYADLIEQAQGKLQEATIDMQAMAQQTVQEGQQMLQRGQQMLQQNMPQGEALMKRGQEMMQEGQRLLQQGQQRMPGLMEQGQQMLQQGQQRLPGLMEQGQQLLQQGQTAAQPYMDRGQQMLQQGQAAMADFLRNQNQSGLPPGANPLGVPDDILAGAMQRGQAVPQEQAWQNAQNEMAKQTRDQILSELDANPGKVPKEKEAQIRRLLADRGAVTPQTLEEINALLRSD